MCSYFSICLNRSSAYFFSLGVAQLSVFASFYLRWRTRSVCARKDIEVGVISMFPRPLDAFILIFPVDFDDLYLQPP